MKVLLCREYDFEFSFELIKCYLALIGGYNIREYNGKVKYSHPKGADTINLFDHRLFNVLRYSHTLMKALQINDNWCDQNGLCPLRIVSIPNDLDYDIMIDQFGYEYVEERHRIY